MRIGRVILASLAPLLSLSAAETSLPQGRSPDSSTFIRLLQSVAHLAGPAENAVRAAAPHHPTLHAFLAVTAITATPLRHSVWMVAGSTTPPPFVRPPRRELLRC
jgi:hypothetical protein